MEHEHACSTHYHARASCDCQIDTADHVHHQPSGEDWVVAYVKGDRLAWCGWPPGEAALADCKLLKKATPSEREKLLRDMAGSMNVNNARTQIARARLEMDGKTPNARLTGPQRPAQE